MRLLITLTACLLITNCLAEPSTINYGSLATFSENGNLQIVVEIPAGTNKKLEYNYDTNTFPVDIKDGNERIINFLPYPGNYGFIPSTMMDKERLYDLTIIAEAFKPMTLLERHQSIYKVLDIMNNPGIHGIKITASSPEEWKK